MNIDSKRKYAIAQAETVGISLMKTDLQDILTNKEGYELFYSIKQDVDALLDLNMGESLVTNIRDHEHEKIIVLRIK